MADPDRVERLLALMDDEAQEVTRPGLGMDGGEARTIEEVSELVNLTPDEVRQVAFRGLLSCWAELTERTPVTEPSATRSEAPLPPSEGAT